ncbi:MAG: sulfatase family protein [Bryobacteraceae bacterium]
MRVRTAPSITRRDALRAGLVPWATHAATGTGLPNIILLVTDDQRWDTLGAMGNSIIRTPHLDRLAAEGVTFVNNFVTTSICMVSRASMFTGQYLFTHGINEFNEQLTPEAFRRCYPGVLRTAGYRMGFIGKWGLDKKPLPEDQFDYWRGFAGQGSYFPQGPGGPHSTVLMGQQAVEFLRTFARRQPFFLQVSFKAPHVQDEDPRQFLYDPADEALYRGVTFPAPRTAASRYLEQLPIEVHRSEGRRRWAIRFSTPQLYQESVRGYYRLISGVDRVVGEIRHTLAELGLARNTIVVFTSDNGFYLGEHGLADKWLMHEESIRTPMIVYDPRLPQTWRGLRRREITLNIDLAPTLLELAGLAVPRSMQGRSLLPLLDPAARPPWRKDFFYEHTFTARGWIPRVEGVRTERWKYTRYLDTVPLFEELYDLAADPYEERNLAREPSSQSVLEAMRARHGAWKKALAESRPELGWVSGEPGPPEL